MHSQLAQDQIHVTVDLLILTIRDGKLGLLLSPRTAPPFEHCWALPGCFIPPEDSAEKTVQNLLDEMLPVSRAKVEQLFTFSAADRDPRGRVISMAYLVIVPWGLLSETLEGENTSSFCCFDLKLRGQELILTDAKGQSIGEKELAFDHGQIIKTGIIRLRNKIDYTDIGFSFLENKQCFPLSDLQTVFEAVLDAEVDSSNFRRFILNRYEKTGELKQTIEIAKRSRGRPAVTYQFDPMST